MAKKAKKASAAKKTPQSKKVVSVKKSSAGKKAASSKKNSAKVSKKKTNSKRSSKSGVSSRSGEKKAPAKPTKKVIRHADIPSSATVKVSAEPAKEPRQSVEAEAKVEIEMAAAAESNDVKIENGRAEDVVTVVSSEKKRKKDEIKFDRNGDLLAQWETLRDRAQGFQAPPYKMSESYEAKTPLIHKVLGWGFVLTSQNDRLEVLFRDGIRVLIANYRSS